MQYTHNSSTDIEPNTQIIILLFIKRILMFIKEMKTYRVKELSVLSVSVKTLSISS